MARTWSLYQTLTLSGSHSLAENANVVPDGSGNVYFWTDDSPDLKVWQWDGTTVTDISDTTFSAAADHTHFGMKVCWFNGELYFAYNDRDDISFVITGKIYQYSGSGQSWSSDYSLTDESANPCQFIQASVLSNRESCPFDCDGSRLIAVGQQTTGSEMRMWARSTGGSWTQQTMPTSSLKEPFESIVGNNKNSDYGEMLAVDEPSVGTFRVIKHGSPWSNLSASNIGARYLIGYADSKSFFVVDNGADFDLYYSTDWGVNITTCNLTLTDNSYRLANNFNNLATDAVMLAKKDTAQVYVWNPNTNEFDTDGTTGTSINGGFFLLGVSLFALCASTSSGEVRVYTAPGAYDLTYSSGGIPGGILV